MKSWKRLSPDQAIMKCIRVWNRNGGHFAMRNERGRGPPIIITAKWVFHNTGLKMYLSSCQLSIWHTWRVHFKIFTYAICVRLIQIYLLGVICSTVPSDYRDEHLMNMCILWDKPPMEPTDRGTVEHNERGETTKGRAKRARGVGTWSMWNNWVRLREPEKREWSSSSLTLEHPVKQILMEGLLVGSEWKVRGEKTLLRLVLTQSSRR